MFYMYNKKIMGFKNCHSLQPCSVTDEDPGTDTVLNGIEGDGIELETNGELLLWLIDGDKNKAGRTVAKLN